MSQRTLAASLVAALTPQRVSSFRRAARAGLLAALAAAAVPAGAGAAQQVERVEIPSTHGYVDLDHTRLNRPATTLEATVVLPDGYDEQPQRRWPVLYLLAGVGDTSDAYVSYEKGRLLRVAHGFPGVIVTPESGRGYFTDWWRGGTRFGSQWERYMLEEVVPFVEQRYRLLPGREHRAIGGVSMGGYGGVLLAGEMPTYFGNAFSMSGLLNSQAPETVNILPIDMGAPYTRVWGRPTGDYATVHNPVRTAVNNAYTRLWLSSGNGRPSGRFGFSLPAYTSGALAEQAARQHLHRFAGKARAAGADVTVFGYQGAHDWPYWRAAMPYMLNDWNPFGGESAAPLSWRYKTMAPRGNVWGLGYRFEQPTHKIATFVREGAVLRGSGEGTVTFTPGAAFDDATGAGSRADCAFTVTLPFEQTLPAGCGIDGLDAAAPPQ